MSTLPFLDTAAANSPTWGDQPRLKSGDAGAGSRLALISTIASNLYPVQQSWQIAIQKARILANVASGSLIVAEGDLTLHRAPAAAAGRWASARILEIMKSPEIAELPLRSAPFPDESINGFIARIAQLNHFKHAMWVAEAAGVKFPQNFYKDDEIGRLATVTARPFDELRRIAPKRGLRGSAGSVSLLLGQDVPTNAIVLRVRRFCPACVATDSTYHRIAWTLRFARACELHECRLVDRCPVCRMPLNWRTEAADKCRCGSPLASMSDVSVSTTVDSEELVGPRYLLRALVGEERTMYPLMEGLRFAELLKAAQVLGLFGAEPDASFKLDDRLTPAVGLWLSRGLRLLTVDPAVFGNQVSSLIPVGRNGPRKRYVRALWNLEEALVHAGVGYAPLGAALRRVLQRYPDGR